MLRWLFPVRDPDLDDFVFDLPATDMSEMAYEEAEFYEALHNHKVRKAQERLRRGYR